MKGGELYVCDDAKVIGFTDNNSRLILGINHSNGGLHCFWLSNINPYTSNQSPKTGMTYIKEILMQGERHPSETLAHGLFGLHINSAIVIPGELYRAVYTEVDSFRPLSELLNTPKEAIREILGQKRTLYDGIDSNKLESIACVNGMSCFMYLEDK